MTRRLLCAGVLATLSGCFGVAESIASRLDAADGGPPVSPPDGAVPLPDAGNAPADAGAPDAGAPGPADAGPCGALDTRLTTVSVSVAPASVDQGSSYGWSNNRPVHFGPLPGGAAKVAWSSSAGEVHVTPLDASLHRSGPDAVIAGVSVRGFVAHADGAVALLVVRGTSMVLVRLTPAGAVDFEKVIVGDTPNETTPGSRWVDGWGHEGRLLWTGSSYVAYFGHTKYWGAQGKHQGDLLQSFSVTGQAAGGPGWDWGCSHSLDVRLAWDGTQAAPVCLSDCYQVKGVLLNDSSLLVDEPSGNCAGSSDGQLGGLAALPGGGFALTFSSKEGRASRDVGFLRLSPGLQKGATVWLASGAGEDDHPQLARYGERLLAAWREAGAVKLAVLSPDGAVLEGPVAGGELPADRDDFATWPEGDVGWATGAGSALTVSKVRSCTP